MHDKILIVDLGSQVTQLIARRVREDGVYSEIVPFTRAEQAFAALQPKGVILSGGPASVLDRDAPLDRVAGEKSTDYLESAAAADRIGRDLPAVKLVFILREPAARAYSNFLWTRMNGLETEEFATALALEAERERTLPERWRFARPFSYFSRGLYAELLEPYLNRFPRERILVLRFEDIQERSTDVADRLHRFLGVAPRPDDADGIGVINPSEKRGEALDEALKRDLQARYADSNRRLAALLGPDFRLW